MAIFVRLFGKIKTMKKYLGLLRYTKPYKKNIFLYFLFTLLSIVFSVVSIAMLFPFMDIIFNGGSLVIDKPALTFSSTSILKYLQYYLSQIIQQHDKLFALAAVCVFIVVSIILKNLFVYLTYYAMSPIRNGVMVQLRNEMYDKILRLPIGYFTEQRKGDLMSRMTEDTWELESAVANTLMGLIKEPLTIVFYLIFLIFLSPGLSLIMLVLLPVAGLIIGRISKSLKKTNTQAAEKSAEGLGILEETLSSMRIIKAFTAEPLIQKKFSTVNDELFTIKNKINYKRDLASPMSEIMGIMVLCVILWFGGSMIIQNEGKGLGLGGPAFICTCTSLCLAK
jgi:subfamily B ATP-binding cassette protein MsbA